MGKDNSVVKGGSELRSPVVWSLLGLIINRPGYGYALVKRFEREYGDALPISSDFHIYRALDALREKGLIEELPPNAPADPAQTGRQPKPHYGATEAGVTRYIAWLRAEVHRPLRHSELLAAQLSMLADHPQSALGVIEEYERSCLRCITASAEGPAFGAATQGAPLRARMVSEERRLLPAAVLPWIEYARAEFRELVRSAAGR